MCLNVILEIVTEYIPYEKGTLKSVTVYQGFRDKNIGQWIIGDLYSKNFTLSIGISMYRYANKVQTLPNKIIYLTLFTLLTFFNIYTHIFTLSISPRSWRDSISFVYSCFIPESLIYRQWGIPFRGTAAGPELFHLHHQNLPFGFIKTYQAFLSQEGIVFLNNR